MPVFSSRARRVALPLLVAILGVVAGPVARQGIEGPVDIASSELRTSVTGTRTIELAFAASHVAVHWPGQPDAHVTLSFSVDGRTFGAPISVEPDDAVDRGTSGETYGNVVVAGGARSVRITSDRPLSQITVDALDSSAPGREARGLAGTVSAAVAGPRIISRAAWGASESLRFDPAGNELWTPVFEPVQKIVIHHTATATSDPNPAATVRSIYRYDAVTKGWGDIGYNFLIDAAGRIYEGRHSRTYAPGEMPTGEDLAGHVVTGAHVLEFNSGVIGIAMLGTFTARDVTPAARAALEGLLAWETERHGISPVGASLYTNPVSGVQAWFPNIAGHRDLASTSCPGGVFYATLPRIRADVAARIAAATGSAVDHVPPAVLSIIPTSSSPTTSLSATFGLVFSEPVTGFTAADLSVTGTSSGWTVAALTGSAAVWSVTITATTPTPGSVALTVGAGSLLDLAAQPGPISAATSAPIAWVADLKGTVTRLAGVSRYETAAAISAATFAPGVPVAYITTGANFPDALTGAVAAALGGGPMLLVANGTLPPATAAELTRLKPGRIVVLGGPSVVSAAMATALAGYTTGTVTRLAGVSRYETAAAISAATFAPGVPVAYITTGANFPDALTGAVAAALGGGPMLLVANGTLPPATAAELTRLKPGRIVVLGGPSVVSAAMATALAGYTTGTVTRLAGVSRYETAAAISAATFAPGVPVAYITTGANFPDALTGAVAAALGGGPMLLVANGTLPPATAAELTRLKPGRIVVLGGPSVVSAAMATALAGYLAP